MKKSIINLLKNEIFLFLICIFIGGGLSLHFGLGINEYDLYNYHVYAPYAFLNDRIGVDVLPAGIRSYFNPILDIPHYLMLKYINSTGVIAFLQGFYYGVVLFLGYKISALLRFKDDIIRIIFRVSSFIIIATTPIILYECGTFFNDLNVSILILFAIYLYLSKICFKEDSSKRSWLAVSAGFLLGAAFGLKLIYTVSIVGIIVALILLSPIERKPFKVIGYSFLGFVLGFLIINGYWYYKIWSIYHNPVFPYFNNIFYSEYGQNALVFNDESFYLNMPVTFMQKLLYPFIDIISFGKISFASRLFKYTDFRPFVSEISVIYLLFYLLYNKMKKKHSTLYEYNSKIILFLIVYFITVFVIWVNFAPNIRYIIPLFVLCPILILYTIFSVSKKCNCYKITRIRYLLLVAILLIFGLNYSNIPANYFNHIRTRSVEKYYETANNIDIKNGALVLLGSQQTSYIIPQLNKNAMYHMLIVPLTVDVSYSLQGNIARTIDFYYSPYYYRQLKDKMKEKRDIYLIYKYDNSIEDHKIMFDSIKEYAGEELKPFDCINKYDLQICKLKQKTAKH